MIAPLKLMVIDDSPVVRKIVGDALEGVAHVRVSATAPNGRIALMKIESDPPDICLLDLEMPEMDGIELIRHLRADHPQIRILVITANGALAESRAVQALMMGADDIFIKPQFSNVSQAERTERVRQLLVPKLLQFQPKAPQAPLPARRTPWKPRALVIGVSTGGPDALRKLLPALPADFPLPVLIVQHMPAGFTAALAERLDQLCPLDVAEAREGERIERGQVRIAPGGMHLEVALDGHVPVTRLTLGPPENSCRPAADVLFRTAAQAWQGDLVVLVLTGMGSDGLEGARLCKGWGAKVLAQDEASSTVWGMPGAVAQAGLADEVLPLDSLAAYLSRSMKGWGA